MNGQGLTLPGHGAVVVSRRTLLQDLLRRYRVLIDGVQVGRLWAFQTGAFPVNAGPHIVQVIIPITGTASSAELEVDVLPEEVRILRTRGRGLRSYASLPLALVARLRGRLSSSRWYQPPWIVLELQDRATEHGAKNVPPS